jgi:antitoxin component HigA of HigAB toxin-antitoxin module
VNTDDRGTHTQYVNGSVSMKISPIKNNCDYREALRKIDRLMDARSNTMVGDRLDVLVTLVRASEEKHWPIDSASYPAFAQQLEAAERVMREVRDVLKKRAEYVVMARIVWLKNCKYVTACYRLSKNAVEDLSRSQCGRSKVPQWPVVCRSGLWGKVRRS